MSRLRCAVYTRKSTEEGLEQGFNSLDAQREACTAYIKSQAGEGWTCLKSRYDDGGISGGTMARPALQRLLADIAAGMIHVVVVYKVDRLTRALSDFAKMVEIFDTHGVSFVSVTQQFNTTTSMGRLTLNVLLSFAQFEREVTAERIRDKIAASKRKGMWMGGVVPLGYEVVDRQLVPNEDEAETVRTLFRLYLELGNVRLLKQEADRQGLRTKSRKPNNGRRAGGELFSRGHIYKLLSNRLYIGEINHKGECYDGDHSAIVDRETWDRVQAQLKNKAVRRHRTTNTKTRSPLAGRLFDERDQPLVPSYASKAGRRYRYYISKSLKESRTASETGWRLPAQEVEGTALKSLSDLLRDQSRLIDALDLSGIPRSLKAILSRAARLGDLLVEEEMAEHNEILQDIVQRIEIRKDRVRVLIDLNALRTLLEVESQSAHQDQKFGPGAETVLLDVPVQFRRRGAEMKLILPGEQNAQRAPDTKLIQAVAEGNIWFEELCRGDFASIGSLARHCGINQGDVSRRIPLAFLAPDVVEAILDGRQPVELTAARLLRLRHLPLSWAEQRRRLGFAV